MFALAEALHAHGHVREAGRLARELAEEMIASGPDAGIDYSATKGNYPPLAAALSCQIDPGIDGIAMMFYTAVFEWHCGSSKGLDL